MKKMLREIDSQLERGGDKKRISQTFFMSHKGNVWGVRPSFMRIRVTLILQYIFKRASSSHPSLPPSSFLLSFPRERGDKGQKMQGASFPQILGKEVFLKIDFFPLLLRF